MADLATQVETTYFERLAYSISLLRLLFPRCHATPAYRIQLPICPIISLFLWSSDLQNEPVRAMKFIVAKRDGEED